MINNISNIAFSGKISDVANKATVKLVDGATDCFEKSGTSDKIHKTIGEAKAKIIEKIKASRVEHGFIIDKKGEIIDEMAGGASNCPVNAALVEEGSLLLHGHPENYPLSSGDVAMLLTTKAKKIVAFLEDGKSSVLTKKYPMPQNEDIGKMKLDFEIKLGLMACDKMGIDYKASEKDVVELGKKYLENFGSYPTDEEVIPLLSKRGIGLEEGTDVAFSKLKELMPFEILSNPFKYNKEQNTVFEHGSKIVDFLATKEGVKTMHEFLEAMAKKHDLIYETDMVF